MDNKLYEALSLMSPMELTQFYRDFISEIQNLRSKYGGFNNMKEAIKKLNEGDYSIMDKRILGKLDVSKLERVNKILRSSDYKEALAGDEGIVRNDIRTLYLSYIKGQKFTDKIAEHDYVLSKVKSYLIFSIMEMSNA